jgi:hypothetical protein
VDCIDLTDTLASSEMVRHLDWLLAVVKWLKKVTHLPFDHIPPLPTRHPAPTTVVCSLPTCYKPVISSLLIHANILNLMATRWCRGTELAQSFIALIRDLKLEEQQIQKRQDFVEEFS